MYQDYFRFHQRPFSIAPDPGFLFLSERHREALAHLMYGLQGDGGFVLVIGEVGTGKTTLVRSLMNQVPEDVDVAFVLNPRVTVEELLQTLCDELGVAYDSEQSLTIKSYIDRLNGHLLKTHALGRSTVVIIDEAQNLNTDVLEQIRLLTNLETNERKLLRIILLGQSELAEVLDRREMRQLAQRITARYHLGALNRDESRAYVAHRLTRAGGSPHLFTSAACRTIYRLSRGVPRLINVIADRALLGSYVEGKQRVTAAVVRKAAREVFGQRQRPQHWIAAAALLVLAVGGAWALFDRGRVPDPPPAFQTEQEVPVAELSQPEDKPEVAQQTVEQSPVPQPNDPVSQPDLEAAIETTAAPVSITVDRVLDRPPEASSQQTQSDSYSAVFARWDVSDRIDGIPCNFAAQVGLQCLTQNGTWADVLRVDRPVILELWDAGAAPFYAAVLEAEIDTALLDLGGQPRRISTTALEGSWFGTYIVLWRMPPDYNGNLRQGDRGPAVRWLRGWLRELLAADLSTSHPEVFDAELNDAVTRFQRQRGLRPDGIVGPATWIEINSAGPGDVPRLKGMG